ncbi:MAG: BsuPI-related putative proteinase inhibitor [Candidatus Bathyarchaeia archaeon]|jgi:hypothetical protein
MKRVLCVILFTILIGSIFVSFSAEPKSVRADIQQNSSTGGTNSAAGIAVSNVTASQSFVEQGFKVTLSANFENSAASTVVFNVTFIVNTIVVSTQQVTLTSGSSNVVSCLWDTTGFSLGNYVVSASAWPIAMGTSASCYTCTGSTILLTILGDLTGQGTVDSNSFFAFVNDYVNYFGPAHQYNPAADFEHNDAITSTDFFDFVNAYIAYWTGPTPFIRNGGLTLTISISQTDYTLGAPVVFKLSINNVSDKTISFAYIGGLFDYIVYNNTGIVYRYSYGLAFPTYAIETSLLPGASLTQSFEWDQVCNLNSLTANPCVLIPTMSCPVFHASAGTYNIVGEALGMQTVPCQITITNALQ